MTLAEMRDYFKEFSGRDNLKNARIDNLLNRAISFLSPKVVGHFGETYTFTGLRAGMNSLDVSAEMNSVRTIWYIDDDGTYVPLNSYLTFEEFLEENPNQTNVGLPAEWVKVPPMALSQVQNVHTNFKPGETWEGQMFDGESRLVLLFSATPNKDMSLRLLGRRKILPLKDGADYNVLTRQEPLLLALTALYYLEFYMRQYKEAQTIMTQVREQLAALDTTSVEAEAEQLGDQIDG